MPKPEYSKSTYLGWIKKAEQVIDAEMRSYWRLVGINGSEIARHERLKAADRHLQKLEKYRLRIYDSEASRGAA